MTIDLLHIPPGVPFVHEGKIYYREFKTAYDLIRCFRVKNGVVDFILPYYFDKSTNVKKYEFKRSV